MPLRSNELIGEIQRRRAEVAEHKREIRRRRADLGAAHAALAKLEAECRRRGIALIVQEESSHENRGTVVPSNHDGAGSVLCPDRPDGAASQSNGPDAGL